MTKANECTCPSGGGSLRHPCPAHPAPVEQAGGDERAAFEAWMTWLMDHVYGRLPDFTLDDGSGAHYVNADVSYAWTAWQARAALAQPSPAQPSPAQAEQAEAERPEVVAYRTVGRHAKHQHPHFALNYYKQNAEDLAAHWRERGCEVSEDELMTVAQHDRIVGELIAAHRKHAAELITSRGLLREERDAALARVAELTATRNRYGVDAHYFNKNLQRILRDFENFTPDELARSLIILAKVADEKVVAQAQHSVPEGYALIPVRETEAMHDAVMALLYKGVARTDTQKLLDAYIAAAPGKEVPQAWLDVQAERRRQVEAEGWTPEHDDAHSHGQMARAAACYALAGSSAPNDGSAALLVSLAWPWDEQWWKPTSARRDLVKACALVLAEIERLDRAASPGKEEV